MGSNWIMDPILQRDLREIFWDHRSDFGIHGHVCLSAVAMNGGRSGRYSVFCILTLATWKNT